MYADVCTCGCISAGCKRNICQCECSCDADKSVNVSLCSAQVASRGQTAILGESDGNILCGGQRGRSSTQQTRSHYVDVASKEWPIRMDALVNGYPTVTHNRKQIAGVYLFIRHRLPHSRMLNLACVSTMSRLHHRHVTGLCK